MLPVIGLPRGRLQGPTYEFLRDFGVHLPSYDPAANSRNYQIDTPHATYVVDHPKDLVKRVALSDLNAAIVGGDSSNEFSAEWAESEKANLGGLRAIYYPPAEIQAIELPPYRQWYLTVLARQDTQDNNFSDMLTRLHRRDIRYLVHSWTEYPYAQKQLMERTLPGIKVGIYPYSSGEVLVFPSSGSTESKLRRGDSMFGLEIVSSGETSRLNGLKEFGETTVRCKPTLIKPRDYKDPFVTDLIGRFEEYRLLTAHDV